MENNLSLIIQYINNNIKFGSKLEVTEVFNLFNKYPISNTEKAEVWKEIDSLDIKILYSNKLSTDEIFELLNHLSSNNEIYMSDLTDWFNKENFSKERQEKIIDIIYSSDYILINNVYNRDFSNNLSFILFYINNNIKFGSTIEIHSIYDLFQKYLLPDSQKKYVWKELDSLKVEIINQGIPIKNEVLKFLVSEDMVYESHLINWFKQENINQKDQDQIRHILHSSKYKIINDAATEKNETANLDLSDNVDNESLDDLIESIIKESNLKDIVDKSHNNEYLYDYQKSEDETKRKDALDNIVKANQKLVWSIVKKYSKFSTPSYDYNDMFQSGMEGLLKAAKKFDFSNETKLSTYATFWIKQSITRGIGNYSTTIRLPIHMREKILNYIKIENKFWNDNGRSGTQKEFSKILKISKEKVNDLQAYKKISNLSSLEAYIGPDGDSTLGEFISEDKSPSPEYYLEKNELREEIELLFDEKLTDREKMVIRMRYGFTDGKEYTLEEIGKVLHVTRERIRQIQAKALKKLKKLENMNRLKEFYLDEEYN